MSPADFRFGEIFDDGAQLDAPAPKAEPDPEHVWRSPAEFMASVMERATVASDMRTCCESPIEVELGAELRLHAPAGFIVIPQFRWKRWRMDFAIAEVTGAVVGFVECDGAEFHQTPDQIANDRRKDVAARASGIEMFRFTGSEIFRHAPACAKIIWRALRE